MSTLLEILDKFNKFISELPDNELAIMGDAKTSFKTYREAIKYVKSFKFALDSSYHATATEQIKSAFNTLCDDVAIELAKEARDQEIKK